MMQAALAADTIPGSTEAFNALGPYPILQACFGLVIALVALWIMTKGRDAAKSSPPDVLANPQLLSAIEAARQSAASLQHIEIALRTNGEILNSLPREMELLREASRDQTHALRNMLQTLHDSRRDR
jgi:hypothetical protein